MFEQVTSLAAITIASAERNRCIEGFVEMRLLDGIES